MSPVSKSKQWTSRAPPVLHGAPWGSLSVRGVQTQDVCSHCRNAIVPNSSMFLLRAGLLGFNSYGHTEHLNHKSYKSY